MVKIPRIKSLQDIENITDELGFLPYFSNEISGFSIEEHIDYKYWFGDCEGAWEWKGQIAQRKKCVYAKLFNKKAMYVSQAWFPDLANWRRDGYDFDALYDDGKASRDDKLVYDMVDQSESDVSSTNLKKWGNFGKKKKKGFDTIITRLQMECYLVVADFSYKTDKKGNQYGWGVAQYITPEKFYGTAFSDVVYQRKPAESREILLAHFQKFFPRESEKTLLSLLGKSV